MSRELMTDLGSAAQDNLIAGPKFPLSCKGVTLKAGQGLMKRGTVLGVIKATGLAVKVNSANVTVGENPAPDGSNLPDCVLAEEIDTGAAGNGAAIPAVAYSAGYFIRGSLIFGGSDTYATHELEMRRLNMHMSASADMEGAFH